jgi:hypothetical protein
MIHQTESDQLLCTHYLGIKKTYLSEEGITDDDTNIGMAKIMS